MINKHDQQKDWPIMAESPAQAAVFSFLKETESLEAENEEEEGIKETTVERFKNIIKIINEKEKSGELATEADGVKMVNEIMGVLLHMVVVITEVPADDADYDVCLPMDVSELN